MEVIYGKLLYLDNNNIEHSPPLPQLLVKGNDT